MERWIWIVLFAMGCGDAEAPAPAPAAVESGGPAAAAAPPEPEPPSYSGEIWCVVRVAGGRQFGIACAESREACDRYVVGSGDSCERVGSAAARHVYYLWEHETEWSGPHLSLYRDMAACVRSRSAPPSGDVREVSSDCARVADEPFAQAQAQALEESMRARAETTRQEIWCHTISGSPTTWCYEGRRFCTNMRQRMGPDRGEEATECERRAEVFAYSYRSRYYDTRERALYGSPQQCVDALRFAQEDNRRGIGRQTHLTECYLLRSAAR